MNIAVNSEKTKKLAHAAGKTNKFKKMVLLFIVLTLIVSCAKNSGTPVVEAESQNVTGKTTAFAALRDSLTKRILEFEPEEYRIMGDSGSAGRLKDYSPAAIKEQVEFCLQGLKELEAVKTSSAAEKLDKEMLSAHLTYMAYFYGEYHGELGNLQSSVYPYDVIQYELQRFATGSLDQASARDHFGAIEGMIRSLPGYLKQQESNLLAGLKLRKPDKEILKSLIGRIGNPEDQDSIRGGLKALGQNLETEQMRSLLSADQRKSIQTTAKQAESAYGGHADFLRNNLMPQAADSWPLGDKEYRNRFRLIYGEGISLDDLVKDAEAELGRLNAEMVSLAKELRPNLSFVAALDDLRKKRLGSGPELLDAYKKIQEKIDDKLTRRLGLPVGAARYLPAPAGVPVGSATNWPAPLLAPGPGIVLVDISASGLRDNSLVDMLWLAAHEGNPGHASQSLFFREAFTKGDAPLCRFFNIPDEVGSVRGNWMAMANIEGWAFYTERLLLASGLLTREERLAALTAQALRAARVVVDVRMHTEGWSRDQVTKYLVERAGISPQVAAGQAFRYSKIPLQALAYYFGARQFKELRDKYSDRYGSEFYKKLLSLGPVPPRLIGEYFDSLKK
jgi:uncharacterized protein (DUF885 family)